MTAREVYEELKGWIRSGHPSIQR